MGKLRDQMVMEMRLRNFSPHTINAYVRHVRSFSKLFGKSPTEMGEREVRAYLCYLRDEKKTGCSNVNIAYSALKFFYVKTLHRRWNVEWLPYPKVESKLPVVLSSVEVKRIFDEVSNLKHRAILMTAYSAGLRISEVANLKVSDIDSSRMQIRVDQGKGKKDRYTLLSKTLLENLQRYYRIYRPREWLFPGRSYEKPISTKVIQIVFRHARKKAGIRKPASVHTLRHSFATHLLESGVDIFMLQRLLGHSRLSTTSKYVHIQRSNLKGVTSPLDLMQEV